MSKHAYCMSRLSKWLPKLELATQRRLNALGNITIQLPPPGVLDDSDMSGGVARQQYRPLTTAEREREEREVQDFLANGGPPGNGMFEGKSEEVARRLKTEFYGEDGSVRAELLEGMFENAQKSAAYLINSQPADDKLATDKAAGEKWKKMWENAVLQAKAATEGDSANIAGCEPAVQISECDYRQTSMFLLHREFRASAKRVNTIAVLTDSTHAVSCGDDGLCWVWKISSGYPRMVFPKHNGPVNTVSVMTDSIFVLSGGSDHFEDEAAGTAFIWDWRGGFEHASLQCDSGSWLSTAEFPAWRLVGLGCSNSFTYVWDWGGGDSVRFPYAARAAEEVEAAIQGRIARYESHGLNGNQRLAIREAPDKEAKLNELATATFPWITNFTDSIEEARESITGFSDFFSNHSFGAVNAMAYVPSGLRFVTGHEDGKVRFWSSDSGELLSTMDGHAGPVRAVAASPTRMEAWSGGDDGTIRYWDLPRGTQKMVINQVYGGPALALAYMPGALRVAVGSFDGYVRIWRISDGAPMCSINCGSSPVRALAVTPSHAVLAGGEDGYVRVFKPERSLQDLF